jgi:hypothetical protein
MGYACCVSKKASQSAAWISAMDAGIVWPAMLGIGVLTSTMGSIVGSSMKRMENMSMNKTLEEQLKESEEHYRRHISEANMRELLETLLLNYHSARFELLNLRATATREDFQRLTGEILNYRKRIHELYETEPRVTGTAWTMASLEGEQDASG